MSMFAQSDVPNFRHRLWLILWFIVIVAVLWALVWLLFFRGSPSNVSTVNGSNKASQKQSSGGSQSNGGSSNASTNSSSATAGSTPSQLANTGAGNILIPFGTASAAGTVAYYIRLRRKVLAKDEA